MHPGALAAGTLPQYNTIDLLFSVVLHGLHSEGFDTVQVMRFEDRVKTRVLQCGVRMLPQWLR